MRFLKNLRVLEPFCLVLALQILLVSPLAGVLKHFYVPQLVLLEPFFLRHP